MTRFRFACAVGACRASKTLNGEARSKGSALCVGVGSACSPSPPETIVFGRLVDVDDQAHDTPTMDPPKPPAGTDLGRNLGATGALRSTVRNCEIDRGIAVDLGGRSRSAR